MSIYSANKNPKLQISHYFDSLIREIDIYIEELLENKLLESKFKKKLDNHPNTARLKNDTIIHAESIDNLLKLDEVEDFDRYSREKIWHHFQMPNFKCVERNRLTNNDKHLSIEYSDYWNETREEMLNELNDFQNEAFKRYETIRDELKRDNSINKHMESIIPRVFEKRFAFILKYKRFSFEEINLVELDFYLSPNECQLLR